MHDATKLLERAAGRAPAPTFTLDDLDRRRHARERARRIQAGVVGLAVAILVLGGLLVGLREHRGTEPASSHPRVLPPSVLPPTTQAPLQAGPGQYYYVRTHEVVETDIDFGPVVTDYMTGSVAVWWSADGSGRELSDWDVNRYDRDVTYQPGEFPGDPEKPNLSQLPTDPEGLREYLVDRTAFNSSPVAEATASPGQSAESVRLTRMIADLLQARTLIPAQRVGLLEVASGLDGVEVDLHATDPIGRDAYRVSFTTTSGPTRYEYFVDPATHDLLAAVESIPKSGQVLEARVVIAVGIVDSVEQVPDPGQMELPRGERRLRLQTEVR